MTNLINQIHDRLKQSPATSPDIAVELGIAIHTVYESMKRLRVKGKVRVVGFGYRISTRCRTRPYLWSAV